MFGPGLRYLSELHSKEAEELGCFAESVYRKVASEPFRVECPPVPIRAKLQESYELALDGYRKASQQ